MHLLLIIKRMTRFKLNCTFSFLSYMSSQLINYILWRNNAEYIECHICTFCLFVLIRVHAHACKIPTVCMQYNLFSNAIIYILPTSCKMPTLVVVIFVERELLICCKCSVKMAVYGSNKLDKCVPPAEDYLQGWGWIY